MAQTKYGRNYRLLVEKTDGDFLIIELPFSIEFSVSRSSLGSMNVCQIRIYNLSPKNRQELRYDWSNYTRKKRVKLTAGYGDNLQLIFLGIVDQGYSYREGVDFVTTIEAQDGGACAGNSDIPANAGVFPAKTPMQTVYKTLMKYLTFTDFGGIGDSFIYDKNKQLILLQRSKSFTGNVVRNLTQLSGNAFFIDNGKSYVYKNEEFKKVQGDVPIISKETGLLNTPLIEIHTVTIDMMFEPSLFVGQLIRLKSQSTSYINNITINDQSTNQVDNYYKISSLKHNAMISPVVCGDAITTVQFYAVNAQNNQDI